MFVEFSSKRRESTSRADDARTNMMPDLSHERVEPEQPLDELQAKG